MRRFLFVLFFIASFSTVLGTPAHAQSRKAVGQAFVSVQEALSLGKMKLFIGRLKKFEIAYLSVQAKLPLEEKEQYQLWIFRFQFKRYQLQGSLPPIREVASFQNIAAISEYIQQFENANISLQKAVLFLGRYNKLFQRLALEQNLRAQIELQSSLSLERDLETLIRQTQIYVAFLRFARDNWSNRTARTRQSQQQDQAIELLKQQQRRATIERSAIKDEQKRVAKSVQEAQTKFQSMQKIIQNQQTTSTALTITGAILMAAGAAGGVVGGLYFASADSVKNNQTPIFPAPGDSPGTQINNLQNTGLIVVGASGGAFLVGLTLVISGVLTAPKVKKRVQAVLRSQEKFLKDHPSRQSFRTSPQKRRLALHQPTLLGIFH
ncbi:MAG: hypothetical protein H6727_04935 [Myxococcales bacterium]|nr:hypothetical protein [Myxococcales bacterium]